MNKKLLACTLALVLSLSMAACGKKSDNKDQLAQKEVTQQKNQTNELTKEEVNKVLPELSKKVKTLLVDNSNKIDEKFNMKDTQILLMSNISKTAYLINSQNEKYGKKDEIVEYSTDTFKDKSLLTVPYVLTEFNGKQTYAFNVDFFAKAVKDKQQLETGLIKPIIHEAVHLVLQKSLENGQVTTAEKAIAGDRTQNYPVLYDARTYRNQTLDYYKKALQSEKEEDKIKYIKMGNYFYKKYLDMNNENKNETAYDKIEGQARYLEYRALAVLNNLDKDENTIKTETKKALLNDNAVMDENITTKMSKNGEYYVIGSLAYANIYDIGEEKELNYSNPLEYLLNKYGYTENEGNKEISNKVKSYYDEVNNNLKNTIDGIDSKLNDDKYIKIKIPVLRKYKENSSVRFEGESIKYNYNNESATIDTISKEIRIGDNRIKLKSATVLTTKGNTNDGIMSYQYVFIPKENVEINKDKLTVQTKEVQIYDAKFTMENGVYKLVE